MADDNRGGGGEGQQPELKRDHWHAPLSSSGFQQRQDVPRPAMPIFVSLFIGS
jgi:hypothetical protein